MITALLPKACAGLFVKRGPPHDAIVDGSDRTSGFFLQQLNQQGHEGNMAGRVNPALVALVREDVRE
jgi:hypothetical protein